MKQRQNGERKILKDRAAPTNGERKREKKSTELREKTAQSETAPDGETNARNQMVRSVLHGMAKKPWGKSTVGFADAQAVTAHRAVQQNPMLILHDVSSQERQSLRRH